MFPDKPALSNHDILMAMHKQWFFCYEKTKAINKTEFRDMRDLVQNFAMLNSTFLTDIFGTKVCLE